MSEKYLHQDRARGRQELADRLDQIGAVGELEYIFVNWWCPLMQ